MGCLASIAFALSLSAQSSPGKAGDEAAIRQVVQKYMDARNQQDSRIIEELFAEDADQLVSSGEWRKGRTQIVQGTMASSERTGGRRTITVESIRFLGPAVALVDGRYELAGLTGGSSRSMWTTLIITREPEGWRIAAIRNMLPATPAPQKSTVERIDIRGFRRYGDDMIRSHIQSKPGGVYDEALLNLDLRAIYATGYFENVEINERDGYAGKIVTFEVRERPLIRSIEFSGFKFELSQIESYFKQHKVDIRVDTLFDVAKVRTAERALEQMLAQQGRHPGKVHTELESIPPSSVRVKFIQAR
jgi:uncharacterized protein (TIGR02246 family)